MKFVKLLAALAGVSVAPAALATLPRFPEAYAGRSIAVHFINQASISHQAISFSRSMASSCELPERRKPCFALRR